MCTWHGYDFTLNDLSDSLQHWRLNVLTRWCCCRVQKAGEVVGDASAFSIFEASVSVIISLTIEESLNTMSLNASSAVPFIACAPIDFCHLGINLSAKGQHILTVRQAWPCTHGEQVLYWLAACRLDKQLVKFCLAYGPACELLFIVIEPGLHSSL